MTVNSVPVDLRPQRANLVTSPDIVENPIDTSSATSVGANGALERILSPAGDPQQREALTFKNEFFGNKQADSPEPHTWWSDSILSVEDYGGHEDIPYELVRQYVQLPKRKETKKKQQSSP